MKRNSRSSLKNNKKYKRIVNSSAKSLIDHDLILSYLQGEREPALENIAYSLKNFNYNEIKPILKKSLREFIQRDNPDFNGNIYFKNCVCHLLKNFKTADFVKRTWQYVPYYLRKQDYIKLHTCQKYPIHISNYNYDTPLYTLNNNFFFQNRKKKKENKYSEEKIKNDVHFYLSKEQDVICAKLITLKYKPKDIKLIKRFMRSELQDNDENKDAGWQFVENNALYSRSLSISMYVLLEGDPNKALPFLRYDSEEGEHTNVFIGDDKRKAIFGEKAKSPHFHFQNETDNLLCMAKFTGDESKKYKTGRCNAIDCPHLKKYLQFLDGLSQKELLAQSDKNLTYGMPFLDIKMRSKAIKMNCAGAIYQFFIDHTEEDVKKISYVKEWMEEAKDKICYKNGDGKKFGKFIFALDLIELINEKRMSSFDIEEKNLLTQLEIICADSLINAISSCQTNEVAKNNTRNETLEIDGTYLNGILQEGKGDENE